MSFGLCFVAHPIVQLDLNKDFICEGVDEFIAAIAAIGALICVVIATVMVGTSIYIYRFEIKILLFEKLNWHPFDKQDWTEDKEYDLYLMYDRKDESWTINTLLVGLERLGYRTCVSDRDFALGSSTAAEMAESFTKTHRVVVVVSQSFVDNDNAMSDFYHAYQHDRSPTGRRFLILINLNNNINFRDRHIFKKYISTNYFIPIQVSNFWVQIRYWLPRVKKLELPSITDNIESDVEEVCSTIQDSTSSTQCLSASYN